MWVGFGLSDNELDWCDLWWLCVTRTQSIRCYCKVWAGCGAEWTLSDSVVECTGLVCCCSIDQPTYLMPPCSIMVC